MASSLLTPLLSLLLPTLIPLLPIPPRYRNDRLTLILILSAYILFTFVSSDLQISTSQNYYSLLGLPRTVEDGAPIKDGWKAWARRNHPDRGGDQDVFVRAREAYDVLSEETRRWGYDRFGPEVAGWKHVVTQREFLVRGVTQSVGFYVMSAGVWVVMKITGQISSSRTAFWRNLLLPLLLILELSLLLVPSLSTAPLPIRLLSHLLPQRTQHQHIRFLHNLYVAAAMANNQLGPLLWPDRSPPPASVKQQEEELAKVAERLSMLVQVAEKEAARMYVEELGPVLGSGAGAQEEVESRMRLVERGMEDVLVETRIRGHPAVRPVWERVVKEGRDMEMAKGLEAGEEETVRPKRAGGWEMD